MINTDTKMLPQKIEANVYDLIYPVFVVPVSTQEKAILHIPGLYEFSSLSLCTDCVLEGYKEKDVYFIYDAIPLELWHKFVCKLPFYERRKLVLEAVYQSIALPAKVQEASCVEITNPIELSDYCDNLLTSGYKKVKIFDSHGEYVFGTTTNAECVELDL